VADESTIRTADESIVRTVAHRRNIMRYRSLLTTELTALERRFIDRRIEEEEAEIRRLSAASDPDDTAIGGTPGSYGLRPYGAGRINATTGC
jgi:hypothetical protein